MSLMMQPNPATERKRQLAMAMIGRGQNYGPIQHPMQGVDRVSSQLLGALMAKKANQADQERSQAMTDTLTRALSGTEGPLPPGMSRQDDLVNILAGNKDLAPMAMQMKLQQSAQPKPKRETAKDASGRLRYIDTGEDVFQDQGEPVVDTEKQFSQEKGLRGEFQELTKDYRKQQEAFGRVIASSEDPSPAGDLALIFNYMKILDPGSVVRESEFATAAASGSFGDRIQAAALKIINGEKLSPNQRADFVGRAAKLYEEATKGFTSRAGEYQGLSEQYQVDPERVVTSQPLYNPEDYANLLQAGQPSTPPTPMTQEAYEAIPSGQIYIDPDDGKQYRKP